MASKFEPMMRVRATAAYRKAFPKAPTTGRVTATTRTGRVYVLLDGRKSATVYDPDFWEPATPDAVDRLLDELFTNGIGEVADRLVLVDKENRDLGGMCRQAVEDTVRKFFPGDCP